MKKKSTTASTNRMNRIGRSLLAASVLGLAGVQSSCSTSSSVAWSRIQEEGLIPYMVEQSADRMPEVDFGEAMPGVLPDSGSGYDSSLAVLDEPSYRPNIFTAQPVAGKPGFVFSPHTNSPLEVDVRGYRIGESVRCPYTEKIFVVPVGVSPVSQPQRSEVLVVQEGVDTSAPLGGELAETPDSLVRPVSEPAPLPEPTIRPETAPQPGNEAETEASLLREIALAERLPADKSPIPGRIRRDPAKSPPSVDDLLALPVDQPVAIPEGKRVPGKPNYVFSPFAENNQVVDVEGHEPGTKVKCPYSGKIFAVPEAASAAQG
ncbi:MAG: hypothetical protein ACR2RV_24085 [Verrucomicrobiales bacterium]